MTRWTRIAAVTPLAVLLLVGAAPARADDCNPVLDLCGVDDVVDDTVDTVSGTVDTATDTTSDATDPVRKVVDDVLGGESAGETPLPGDRNGGGSDDGGRKRHGENHRGRNSGGIALGTDGLPTPARSSLGNFSLGSETSSIGNAVGPPPDPSLPDRLAAGAAKGIATVLVLLGVAVAFVLIQDRLDKKDPKLALAPTRSDVVRFG
jgi:hypothetical protein